MYTPYHDIIAPEFEEIFHPENYSHQRLPNEIESGVIGKDTRKLISNTRDAPFRYICQLRFGSTLAKSKSIGTGVLIDKKTLLTAAHVVFTAAPSDLYIIPGKNGEDNTAKSNPFGYIKAAEKIISDEYIEYFWKDDLEKAASYDYAIVQLEKDISAIGFWGQGITKEDKTGSSIFDQSKKKTLPLPADKLWVNLSGYPSDRSKGDRQYLAYNRAVRLDKAKQLLYYENDTYSGHSGSPVWIRRSPDNGGRVLIGIHKGSGEIDEKRKVRLTNRAVFISASVKKFIDQNRL